MTVPARTMVELQGLSIERAGAGEDPGVRILVSDFTLVPGDSVALVGPSGSGKTSILEVLGLLTRPQSVLRFRIHPPDAAGPTDVAALAAAHSDSGYLDRTSALRASFVATVPQRGALLSHLTGLENAALHPALTRLGRKAATERIMDWAQRLGVERQLLRHPGAVSGGEAQRLSLVRALAPGPGLILADEPTASLDPTRKAEALELMREAATDAGAAVVIATHAPEIAGAAAFEIVPVRSRRAPDGVPEHNICRRARDDLETRISDAVMQ